MTRLIAVLRKMLAERVAISKARFGKQPLIVKFAVSGSLLDLKPSFSQESVYRLCLQAAKQFAQLARVAIVGFIRFHRLADPIAQH